MKIFILGFNKSGRTTVAKAIASHHNLNYIEATSWLKPTFRNIKHNENKIQYDDEYQNYVAKMAMVNPQFIINHVNDIIKVIGETSDFVIDGITSPRDLALLFDYRYDMIVFLNRIDNDVDVRDQDNIAVSVMRDYCFWLSSAGLLKKTNWLEYNFRIPGEDSDSIKVLGAQNSVFIVKSINNVISHLFTNMIKL